jgi:hypothetical protein
MGLYSVCVGFRMGDDVDRRSPYFVDLIVRAADVESAEAYGRAYAQRHIEIYKPFMGSDWFLPEIAGVAVDELGHHDGALMARDSRGTETYPCAGQSSPT